MKKYSEKLSEENNQAYLESRSGWLVKELSALGIEVPFFHIDARFCLRKYEVVLQCKIVGDYKSFGKAVRGCFQEAQEPEINFVKQVCTRVAERNSHYNYDVANRFLVLKGDISFSIDYPDLIRSEQSLWDAYTHETKIDFDTEQEQLFLAWVEEVDKTITPEHKNWTSKHLVKVCHYLPENQGA